MDGSWGMDGDHMGEHGRWAVGAEAYLPKRYMFRWDMFHGLGLLEHQNMHWAAPLKLGMFRWVVGFEVLVSRLEVSDRPKQMLGCH